MSRAFVKEDGPDNTPLPDLPIPPQPNHVTAEGLAALHRRLAGRQADLAALRARPERLDRLPEAAAERDIRYLDARLRSAILVDPATLPADEMAFGRMVITTDDAGRTRTWRIVGEDEADAAHNLITPHSPLGRALMGARVGDVIEWPRPNGQVTLTISHIG